MGPTLTAPDVRGGLAGDRDAVARIHAAAMDQVKDGLVGELRAQVEGAGLGTRVANAWRGKRFPGGQPSLDPAAFVWTKAAKIIDAFASGATIYPTGGRRYLAIPTDNVPMKGRGRRMTPLDVEVAFNQDLIIRHGRDGHLLAFVNAIAARNAKGFRRPTKARLGQGRAVRLVLMFTLLDLVRLSKRLDPDGAAARWADRFDPLVQAGFDQEFGGSA